MNCRARRRRSGRSSCTEKASKLLKSDLSRPRPPRKAPRHETRKRAVLESGKGKEGENLMEGKKPEVRGSRWLLA